MANVQTQDKHGDDRATDDEVDLRAQEAPALRLVPDERNDFLAMAVHELRGPITILVGCGETLDSLWERPELPRFGPPLVATMVSSGRRLRQLVSDLLTTSYLEHGSLVLDKDPVPLLPVIQWACEAGPSIENETIRVQCPPDLCVLADSDRVEQILTNLIGNSIQHGASPRSVTARRLHSGDAEVAVRDNGPGIGPEDREHLFEPFSPLSAHSPTSSGLGLCIARTLARAMGGDLTYDERGGGATFRLRLPTAGIAVVPR